MYDLHLHTTLSDGAFTPSELVDLCHAQGLAAIAITDHNTTDGVDEAVAHAAAIGGPVVLPGVELSTGERGVHILGYFNGHRSPALQGVLHQIRLAQRRSIEQTVSRLRRLGVRLDVERVAALAGPGSIGRRHVALAMVEAGAVESIERAFACYLGEDGEAHVAMDEALRPAEAVRAIVEAGGVAALAHPHTVACLPQLLPAQCAAGLGGLELYCPDYGPGQRRWLQALADEHGLLSLGGSDFHEPGGAQGTVRTTGMPATAFARLTSRLHDQLAAPLWEAHR